MFICPSLLPMAIRFRPTSSAQRMIYSERERMDVVGCSDRVYAHSTLALCCSGDTPNTLSSLTSSNLDSVAVTLG